MNKARRQKLLELVGELEILAGDEQQAHDNLPEGLQEADAGERLVDNAEELEQAAELARAVAER